MHTASTSVRSGVESAGNEKNSRVTLIDQHEAGPQAYRSFQPPRELTDRLCNGGGGETTLAQTHTRVHNRKDAYVRDAVIQDKNGLDGGGGALVRGRARVHRRQCATEKVCSREHECES